MPKDISNLSHLDVIRFVLDTAQAGDGEAYRKLLDEVEVEVLERVKKYAEEPE